VGPNPRNDTHAGNPKKNGKPKAKKSAQAKPTGIDFGVYTGRKFKDLHKCKSF